MGEVIKVIEKDGKVLGKQINPFTEDLPQQDHSVKKVKKIKLQDVHDKTKDAESQE